MESNNTIQSYSNWGSISGGRNNSIAGFSQQFSFIGGGCNNKTSGQYSAILGGCGNNITHNYAAAFGHGVASSMSCAFHANNFVAQNIQSYLAGATSNLLQYLVAPASLGFPAGTCIVVTS